VQIDGSVKERADEVTAVVEAYGLGGYGSGKINLRERALAEEKAMLISRVIKEESSNITPGIDVVGFC